MSFEILPDLTKEYVLKFVSQEDIFEHFSGIPVTVGERICSPFRDDPNPTCEFYYNSHGKIKFRDFNGDFWGDCFDAVVRMTPTITDLKGRNFKLVLEEIAKAFSLHKFKYNSNVIPRTFINKRNLDTTIKDVNQIQIKIRHWDESDMKYWRKIGKNITPEILKYFNIYPVQTVWVNGLLKYGYKRNDPAYSYYTGEYPDGNPKWRVYFPKRDFTRFYTNNTSVQGLKQVFPAKFGLVTKSLKDIVCAFSFGITAIAPAGESIPLSKNSIFTLKSNAHYTASLYDYDNAGIRGAINLKKQHGIIPILFTDSIHNRNKGYKGCKDLSDYCVKYGVNYTETMIKEYIESYDEIINLYDSYERELFRPSNHYYFNRQ